MFLRSALARSRPLLVRSSKSSSRRLLSVSTTLPSATLTHTESASVSSPSTSTSSPAEVPGHPPVDWKLYRSLFKNSPTSPVTVYESICELGYDGAFEAFLRSLPDQRHFALAKRIVGYEPKYELLQRAKRLKRPNETMYLGHMMELLQVETLVIGGKSFAGGSYMEWLDWADIKDPIKGQKVSSRDPTKGDWGLFTLKPPTANPSTSGAVDPHRYFVEQRKNKAMRQLHFNRSVRYGPNSPARGGFRLNIGVVDWPVGVPVAFCIWFDVEKRLLRLTDREGKDVATSLTVKDMAYSKYLHRLLELGLSEGLIDKDEAERGRASRQLNRDCDTLDLGTNLARGGAVTMTQELEKSRKRLRVTFRFRDPAKCLHSPGPEAELGLRDPSINNGQGRAITQNDAAPSPAESEDDDDGEDDGDGEDATEDPKGVGRWTARLCIVPFESPLKRAKAIGVKDGDDDIDIIPYITVAGSFRDPSVLAGSGGQEYLIETRTALSGLVSPQSLLPRPDLPEGSKPSSLARSRSPHSLRFYLPDSQMSRDLEMVTKSSGGKVVVAFTGEEMRSRSPPLFDWARARGWWKEVDLSEPVVFDKRSRRHKDGMSKETPLHT